MSRRVSSLLLFFILPALSPAGAAAAPKHEGFFSKNFAVTGTAEQRDPFFDKRRGISPLGAKQDKKPALPDGGPVSGTKADASPTKLSIPALEGNLSRSGDPGGLMGGAAIQSLSLIINGADTKHLDENLSDLLTLKERRGIKLGKVHIANFAKAMAHSNQTGPLKQAGAVCLDARPVLDDYPVSRSPTWIVQTADGVILIEGAKISRYVNRKGEFVEK